MGRRLLPSGQVLWQGLRGPSAGAGLRWLSARLAWWGSLTGRCVTVGRARRVAQWPNTAPIVWIAASVVLALSDPDGTWGLSLRVVATVALSWWAVDEIVRGVNPWRRLLGVVVFAGLVVSLLR
jgi:hypothetical protein